MSTRCNILVKDNLGEGPHYLYRHCDGYPTSILPMLLNAWKLVGEPDWQCGRAGKVAGLICAAGYHHPRDPKSKVPYERAAYPAVEVTDQIHGDVEWIYVVTAQNKRGGSIGDCPSWEIEVRRPDGQDFWDSPTLEKTRLVATGSPSVLARRKKSIEAAG